jgi:hypothetical protein
MVNNTIVKGVFTLYKKVLLLILCFIFLIGCSNQASSPPEHLDKDFWKTSIEIITILEHNMENVEELTDKEDQKIELFFNRKFNKGNPEEDEILILLKKLKSNYLGNLAARSIRDYDAVDTTIKYFTDDLAKLKDKLAVN